MTAFEAIFCIFLMATSAIFSSSEVALFSLSRFQLRYLRENFGNAYKKIRRLLSDPGGLLLTILIANEVVNISLSTVIESAIARNWEAIAATLPGTWPTTIPPWQLQMAMGILITTPIILLICDVTPKVFGARANQMIATLLAGFVLQAFRVTGPLRILTKRVVYLLTGQRKDFRDHDSHPTKIIKEEDFLLMVEEGHNEGKVNESEVDLIQKVFKLDNTQVSQIFTPLQQAFTMPATTTISIALAEIQRRKFYRIPIYGKSRSAIIGILYAKDLMAAKLNPQLGSQPVDRMIRKPLFVAASLPVNSLFTQLKRNKTHMAVVVDDRQNALGIVTLGDIIDELFEDIL
ncbi:MAG: CNNM domain-containing protein [Bacteriovoracia bacterium]